MGGVVWGVSTWIINPRFYFSLIRNNSACVWPNYVFTYLCTCMCGAFLIVFTYLFVNLLGCQSRSDFHSEPGGPEWGQPGFIGFVEISLSCWTQMFSLSLICNKLSSGNIVKASANDISKFFNHRRWGKKKDMQQTGDTGFCYYGSPPLFSTMWLNRSYLSIQSGTGVVILVWQKHVKNRRVDFYVITVC